MAWTPIATLNGQPLDADLTAIAAISPTNDDVIQRKSGAWTNRTPAQVKTDLVLAKADVGLSSVDNTTDLAKPISTATATAIDDINARIDAGVDYGGWGVADRGMFGDKLSLFPRALLLASAGGFKSLGINAGASAVPMQHAYVIPTIRDGSFTGIRYVTGVGAGTTGNTVTVTPYTGTSLAALTKRTGVAAPFTTASTFTQVAIGSSVTFTAGYLVLVFTVTAINSVSTPPRLATNSAVAYGGAGFLAPTASTALAVYRLATSTLPTTLDLTTGWTADPLPPWLAAY